MAIPKELEPLTEGFTAEELKLFDGLLAKQYQTAKAKDPNAPTLQEGWLRQQEFDKRSNEWKTRTEKAEDLARKREEWYRDNKPIHDQALERNRELEAQREELERKLSEAEQRRAAEGGDQVDAAELKRRVEEEAKNLGWMSKTEMQTLINNETAKLAREEASKAIDEARKELWEQSFPQIANHAADISEIAYDHKAEFHEPFDRLKFTEFLSERKITDFKKGYEEFVKPRRDEVAFKAKVEAEVQQRISGMTVNGGMPVAGGPQPKGALQMRIEKDAAAAGSSLTAAAAAAAAELRSEGRY